MGITGEAVVADETMGSLDAMNAWLATWGSALDAPAPAPTTDPTPEPTTEPQASPAADTEEAGATGDGAADSDDEE